MFDHFFLISLLCILICFFLLLLLLLFLLFIDVPTAYSNPDIEVEYGVYARDS